MPFSPSARPLAFASLASGGALVLALVTQYGFGFQPCQLCLVQRLPFGAVLFLCTLGLLPAVPTDARRQIVLLCAAVFAVGAGIAAYHAGVEYHWWAGPSSCAGGGGDFSLDSLAAALGGKTTMPSCDEAALRILGVSMAGANAVFSTVLAAACAWAGTRANFWSAP